MKKIVTLGLLMTAVAACSLFRKDSRIDVSLIPVLSGEKFGYITQEGKIEINPQFEEAYYFSPSGLALVRNNGKYGFIGKDGKYRVNPVYLSAGSFSEGLACVVPENGKPQYINEKNEIVIGNVDADYCGSFIDGLARIARVNEKKEYLWGFINSDGKIVINPSFDDVYDFSEGLAAVRQKSDGKKEALWGYTGKDGKISINYQFKDAYSFSEGLAAVSNGKQYGFIDRNGKFVITPQFDEVSRFQNGLAAIRQGKSWGYIDKKGIIAINPQFDEAYPFSENGLALVSADHNKWGYIGKDGKYVINAQFDYAQPFTGNYALIVSSGKTGVISEEGKYLVNPQYDESVEFDMQEIVRNSVRNPVDQILMGLISTIQSDYFDAPAATAKLINELKEKTILSMSNKTTAGEIRKIFPLAKDSYSYKNYNPEYEKEINANMLLKNISFSFGNTIFDSKPVYRNERRYSYYYGYYNQRVIDHYDKTYRDNELLTGCNFEVKLTGNITNKGGMLAKELKRQMTEGKGYSDVDYGEKDITDRDDNKSLFLFRSSQGLFILGGYEGNVFLVASYDASREESLITNVKNEAGKFLKKEDKKKEHRVSDRERRMEERRVADSIRISDSLAMVQAEQQRIADSIVRAAEMQQRRR